MPTRLHARAQRRPVWLAAVLTLLLLAALPAAQSADARPAHDAGRGDGQDMSRNHASTSPPASTAEKRRPRAGRGVGFSTGFSIVDATPSSQRRQFAGMRALGVRRVRLDISWARVEGTQGQYDWVDTDRMVQAARKAGLKVLGVLCYEPAWAQTETPSGEPASVDPGGFSAFAGAAAARYAGRVAAWEIWNEPNLEGFWRARPDPTAYARLVEATAGQIRSRSPEAGIVVGALAPAVDAPDGAEISPETFLREMYGSLTRRDLFDAVSIHPYSYPAMPDDPEAWNTFHRLPAIHRLMRDAGNGDARLWLTEYGAPTGRSERAVSARRQAAMLVKALRRARSLDFVGPIYFYSYRDSSVAPADPEANFGVLTHRGRPKSSFWALRRALD